VPGTGKAVVVALAVLSALPAAAAARVTRAETVLPPGQSGFLPQQGTNPHLTDQVSLFESFQYKPAGFDEPGTSESPAPGVTITRDAYGVPNVRAGNDRDLWLGVGYAMAQDRLVQLELFRRSTQGRLAEVLGEDQLENDIVARRDYFTLPELRRMLRALPAELRARFDAYADGVNLWLSRVQANSALLPQEFALLKLQMQPWRAVDSASIGVQLARTIPSGDGRELENWRALRALGGRRFAQLLPLRTPGQVATIPASEGRFPSNPGRTRRDERVGYRRSRRFLRGVRPRGARLPEPPPRAAALTRGRCAARAARGCSTGRSSVSRSPNSSPRSRCTGPGSTRAASSRPASRWSASAATTTSHGA
jgi:penicillin G amidase